MTQQVISLSSGEAEFYALVRAGSHALGLQSMLREFGVEVGIVIKSDASAAIGIAKRKGLGKVRHVDVSQLWIQEKVASGSIKLVKVGSAENLADALTKYVKSEDLNNHVNGLCQYRIASGIVSEEESDSVNEIDRQIDLHI